MSHDMRGATQPLPFARERDGRWSPVRERGAARARPTAAAARVLPVLQSVAARPTLRCAFCSPNRRGRPLGERSSPRPPPDPRALNHRSGPRLRCRSEERPASRCSEARALKIERRSSGCAAATLELGARSARTGIVSCDSRAIGRCARVRQNRRCRAGVAVRVTAPLPALRSPLLPRLRWARSPRGRRCRSSRATRVAAQRSRAEPSYSCTRRQAASWGLRGSSG
jgi:hypothetical protein